MGGKKKDFKVPFDGKGNMLTYASVEYPELPSYEYVDCAETSPGARLKYDKTGWYRYVRAGEWRDNYVFHATLSVTGITRGRSAARINLEDEQGRKYEMFLTDVADLLQRAPTIAYGMIEADWTFQKRGSNYGIRVA